MCRSVGRSPISIKSEAALLNFQQWTENDQMVELALSLYNEILDIYSLCDSSAIGTDIEKNIRATVESTFIAQKTAIAESMTAHIDFLPCTQDFVEMLKKESKEDQLKAAESHWKELKRAERKIIEFTRIMMMLTKQEQTLLKYVKGCAIKRRAGPMQFLVSQFDKLERLIFDFEKKVEDAHKSYTRLSLSFNQRKTFIYKCNGSYQ